MLEIRRASWRDAGLTRDLGILSGLALAWGACTFAIVLGLEASPLVVAAGVVLVALVCTPTRAAARSAREPGPTPPPGWAA